MPFVKGQIANPKGRQPSAKPFQAALSRVLAQDSKKLRKIADQLVNAATAGEPWAIQMIADRLDGKVIQQVHSTEGENFVPPALLVSATKLLELFGAGQGVVIEEQRRLVSTDEEIPAV